MMDVNFEETYIFALYFHSPCYISEDSDIRLASRRIGWGKYVNAGQVSGQLNLKQLEGTIIQGTIYMLQSVQL